MSYQIVIAPIRLNTVYVTVIEATTVLLGWGNRLTKRQASQSSQIFIFDPKTILIIDNSVDNTKTRLYDTKNRPVIWVFHTETLHWLYYVIEYPIAEGFL